MLAKILISSLESRIIEAGSILTKHNLYKNHPDTLWFENDEKLGVEQVKSIRAHISLKPYSAKGRAIVLESAQNLTPEAQNALLKTLEEPPESAIIILGADSETTLLPTLLSRCQVIRIKNQESRVKLDKTFVEDIDKLTGLSIEQRFAFIEKLEDKEAFLQALINLYQIQLQSHTDSGIIEFTKQLLEAEKWAKANCNIRAILEYLMIEMPEKVISDK